MLVVVIFGWWLLVELDNEDMEGIILWVEVKDSFGLFIGVCEFYLDIFVKDEDVNLMVKVFEYIVYLLEENERFYKEFDKVIILIG